MKETKGYMELMLMVFWKTNSNLGQMCHFGPKIACRDNSGSTLRNFLKFCLMKGAKRYMKIMMMVFSKKISMGHFGPENGVTSYLWILSKNFVFNLAQ